MASDDDENGVFEGEGGQVTASVVGAAKYANERVWFGFRADGMDSPVEIRDPMMFDPVE